MSKSHRVARGMAVLAVLGLGGIAVTSATAGAAAPTASPSPSSSASVPSATDPNLYPFGAPTGGVAVKVPAPPQEPTLSPTYTTKTTTRIYGSNPYEEAVSVTQHIWPAALPENAPNETNNVPDRPWGITLITPDDPLSGISAVPLIHFPDDAPVLFVNNNGVPDVTLNEIKRLGDTGIVRPPMSNADVFLVGAAANAKVESQLTAIGIKYKTVTGSDVFSLADNVDKLYGSIQNPDLGVPQMGGSASSSGNGMQNVFVGSADGNDWQYYLPATHWASHMPTGMLWSHRNSLPSATVDALKRRNGHALIYVFGGPNQVSASVVQQLSHYGAVQRITADDPVAFNTPATTTPENISVAFAKMHDPAGQVGWGILGPGHGFTLVNVSNWQGAVASAPLSHLGFHAPMLVTTDSNSTLPTEVDDYYKAVAPTFLDSPGEGPYNMTYLIGSWNQLSWPLQAHIDYDSEMSNRRVWSNNNGGRYSDSSQP
ncbi:hypothetical protein EV644_11547 [Kribbella orskensis]|uniref:Cell wall binding repeat protein n=1 Tax=Kribbella orskensis TaxID=2512216 RepID=A0ABY2BE24_9ACTN|nr:MULTISPECIES: hypothetical protein [Kribbella]TCN35485.1 hypothetical protein EV642_11647 [Kribbella sp. VKM Ac-2500]TCO17027.1 hypothetical protein EV644_11547 [Kribbella orskensis]